MIRSIPRRLARLGGRWLGPDLGTPSEAGLHDRMKRYRVDQLAGLSADAFEARIRAFMQMRADGALSESPGQRRDLSLDFHWGHDHDFGTFALEGRMGARHVRHLAEFVDRFKALPLDLEGARVLDIGCWTGGTSLLLCALGARVVAIEEVEMYADCVSFLKDAFGLDRLEVRNCSLYDCTSADFQDAFDFVLFAGVLYHVTDPILALRITFNSLKDGGACLLETTGFRHRRPLISFQRRRWNWFDFSPSALRQMLTDVGYTDLEIGSITPRDRLYAVARRREHVDMRRDGLSVRDIR